MAASIPDQSLPTKVQIKLKRHGARNVLHAIAVRALNVVFPFKILRGVYVEEPDARFLGHPPAYVPGFLNETQLRAFAADDANEMSPAFVVAALAKRDECYALRDGAKLAAYGWYATTPTTVGTPTLLLHFSPSYVYMYKGFTGDAYRGQRLHAIGMTRALQAYRQRGFRGLVSYVESTNFDSLKSCDRMGYHVFGSIYLLRLFGRDFAFSSPGCRQFDFRVEKAQ